MSDTEYDNVSDEDDEWMVESAVPAASEKFRSEAVYDRRFPSPEKHSPVRGPNRQRTQPVQASLTFHRNNSFDADSVCSGTFTIDLSTLQSIQNHHRQQIRVANQPDQFGSLPNNRRSRPYSSMSVNDPESISYGRKVEDRVPYSYPHSRQATSERQAQFSSDHQYRERMKNDPRQYQAPRSHYNFAEQSDRYEPFQNREDYSGRERSPYIYESASCNTFRDDYRSEMPDCNSHAGYGYSTDTDLRRVRPDGHRRLPCVPGRGRGDSRGQVDRYVDDPAPHQSSAPGYRCSESHVDDRYEDYGPQIRDRYDYVPTLSLIHISEPTRPY